MSRRQGYRACCVEGSAIGFHLDLVQNYQVLGVESEEGRSGSRLRPAS